jgi:hypothetical protein
VPEEPLQALELFGDLDGRVASQALGHLPHDRQAHRDVEPVDEVLGLRVEVERELSHVGSAVRQERDLLVHLHA